MNINDIFNRIRGTLPVKPVSRNLRVSSPRSGTAPLDFGHPYVGGTEKELSLYRPYHNPTEETSLGPLDNREFFQKMYDFQMRHYNDFLRTLNDPERKMLDWKRTVGIGKMGNYLRFKSNNIPNETSLYDKSLIHNGIRVMDGIIKRSPPLKQDLILYRGLKLNPKDVTPGTHIYEPGFMSVSLNPFVASGFGNDRRVYRIRVPAGTQLAPVTAHQFRERGIDRNHPDIGSLEQELALGRGHTLKITGTMKGDPHRSVNYFDTELMPQGQPGDHHRRPLGSSL